jgi:hypothetical protein
MRIASMSGALLCALLASTAALAQVEVQPACYSTSDSFIDTQLILTVKPSNPVLVQRFQAPNIRIFCVLFEESAAADSTCTQASTPVLCSRLAADANSAFSCESLTQYTSDPNAKVERGSINGPDMIWDLMWDGTAKAVGCYPRAVHFRALALVRGKDVSSTAVFVILLIVAILAVILIALVFAWFIHNRLRQIDEAGAITIAGPKATYQGPQMAVAPGGGLVGVDKVYQPVNEKGALVEDQSAHFGGQPGDSRGLGATPAQRTRRGPKRASPPAPGDGLPGGASQFRGAQRNVFGNRSDDDLDDDADLNFYDPDGVRRYRRDGSVAPPGTSVRRRGRSARKGGRSSRRGGGGEEDPDAEAMQAMGYATLFPPSRDGAPTAGRTRRSTWTRTATQSTSRRRVAAEWHRPAPLASARVRSATSRSGRRVPSARAA